MYIPRFPLHFNQIISWQIGHISVFLRTTKRPQSPIKCQPARQTLTRPKYILTMACNNFIDCSRTASSCPPPSTIHQPLQLMNSLRSVSQTFSIFHTSSTKAFSSVLLLPACLSVCLSFQAYVSDTSSVCIHIPSLPPPDPLLVCQKFLKNPGTSNSFAARALCWRYHDFNISSALNGTFRVLLLCRK